MDKVEIILHYNAKNESVMSFYLKNAIYDINLNSDSENDLNALFCAIIEELFEHSFKFELKHDNENYKNALFIEVANEYISSLNKEIDVICDEIKKFEIFNKEND